MHRELLPQPDGGGLRAGRGDAAERCPVFPGVVTQEHWALADPAGAVGSEEEIHKIFQGVRDELGKRVRGLLGSG